MYYSHHLTPCFGVSFRPNLSVSSNHVLSKSVCNKRTYSIAPIRYTRASLDSDSIRLTTEKLLAEQGFDLHDLSWKNNTFSVTITGKEGAPVDVDVCASMSRVLGQFLDPLLDEVYTLQVSTPGVKEILTEPHEFEAFNGFPVTLTKHDNKIVKGSLKSVDANIVEVAVKGRIVKVNRDSVSEIRLSRAHEIT